MIETIKIKKERKCFKLVTWFEQVALWSAITRSTIELNELIEKYVS